ncbi:M23 family metallopeptidase [Pseudoalteromonas fenneropenaei]|uniref:M23 family metallopeptidase n=1 Tax=Pseudoalteromonas fenneropenaei TaxID=1737459 RepID=A0ABV7CIE9_9GAMM
MDNLRVYFGSLQHAELTIACVLAVSLFGCTPTAENTALMAQTPAPCSVQHQTTDEPQLDDMAPQLPAAETVRPLTSEQWVLKSGQTFSHLLQPLALSEQELLRLAELLSPYLAPEKMPAGQTFTVKKQQQVIQSICTELSFSQYGCLQPSEQGWQLELQDFTLTNAQTVKQFRIDESLFRAASKADVPLAVSNQALIVLSHFIDFQRDIREGDEVTVVYEETQRNDGSRQSGQLQAITFAGKQHQLQLYYFDKLQGGGAFYHQDGRLAQSFLLKTPIEGARLSSKFGKRHHPVLGYTRVHKGLDFSAPVGTPIMAAGAGKVVHASKMGSFGNMVKLEHGNGYTTLYAHLKGFAKGIKVGTQVKQGQVIGYLGNTGLSQARHLHYEIHRDNKAINPLDMKRPSHIKLPDTHMARFAKVRNELNSLKKEVRIAAQQKLPEELQAE